VVARPIVYVEKPYLQAAAFHLLAGIKNAGKGTWLALQAARVTRGELGERRHVLWIALGEDSYAIDVKPRILAAGGDPVHVTVLQGSTFLLPDHAVELERKAAELGDVGMIVLDPVGGAMQAGKSTNFDADVRPALQALNRVADVTEAMVFGVRHISIKPERRRDGALAGILGSSDWVNIPRVVLALLHDDVDSQTRHLFVMTGNRSRDDAPGLMVRIEGHLLPGHEHEVTRMRVLGESAKDPDELLAIRRQRKATKTDAARKVILDLLYGAEGQRIESDILDAEVAQRTGLAAQTMRNIRNVMRADGLIRAVPQKDAEGEIQRWLVTLTGAGAAAAVSPDNQIPSTHNLKVSGLNTPDTELSVSVPGETRDLDEDAEPADFVTPEQLDFEASS
jgi:AAA domain